MCSGYQAVTFLCGQFTFVTFDYGQATRTTVSGLAFGVTLMFSLVLLAMFALSLNRISGVIRDDVFGMNLIAVV